MSIKYKVRDWLTPTRGLHPEELAGLKNDLIDHLSNGVHSKRRTRALYHCEI